VKLSSDFAGLELKEYHTDITWRRTMNYAAAVSDIAIAKINVQLRIGVLVGAGTSSI
jgi:hypothetical protein